MREFVNTYDPKKVIITFGGVPLTGFADGTFVQIDPSSEFATKKVGADGEVIRSLSNDFTHTIQITLSQTSASNNYLSTCANIDKLSGKGMLPLSIVDLNGTTVHFWAQAWISQEPSETYEKESGDRQWTFETGQEATAVIGGNILP